MKRIREMLDLCKVTVPEGEIGRWRVERFTISKGEAALFNINARGRNVEPGTYTRLMPTFGLLRDPMMSDTPAERYEALPLFYNARGRILVHGLGLGMVIRPLLSCAEVTSVEVVEKDADILALVAPHYRALGDARLTICQGDAFNWTLPRGVRWDFVWHDIWHELSADNLAEMRTLHRRFARRAVAQDSWGRASLRR